MLGEVAWAVEQVLNHWLQEEKATSHALMDFIAQARDSFAYWVSRLRVEGSIEVDAEDLLALAQRLKSGADAADNAASASLSMPPENAVALKGT